MVVESYHSLEDRLVKQAFAAATRSDVPPDLPFVPEGHEPALRLVTRGAEQADAAEIEHNPRAASVRLRAIERVRNSGHSTTQRSRVMSSPAAPAPIAHHRRSPGIAEAAVERARLRVVPAAPYPGARVPFVALVEPGPARRRDRAAPLQHLHAAGGVRDHRAGAAGAHPHRAASRPCEMELDVLRNPQRVAEQAQAMGMVPARHARRSSSLADGKVLGEPTPATRENGLRLLPRRRCKPAVLDPRPDRPPGRGRRRHGRRSDGGGEPAGDRTAAAATGRPRPRLRPRDACASTSPLTRAGRPRRPRGALRGSPLFRLRFGFVVIAMVLSVFGARLVQLQGLDPKAYAEMAAAEGIVEVCCRPTAATSSTATASRSPRSVEG